MLTPTPDELRTLEAKAAEAADMLKLIANDRRLLILCRLIGEREMTVTALAAAAALSQSAASQHLAKLRDQGLVAFRREGTTLHYRIADPRAERVIAVLKDIYCAP